MTTGSRLGALRREILADIDLDYVALGQIAFQVGEALVIDDPIAIRSMTLQIIGGLLQDGLIEAGMPQGMDQPTSPAASDQDPYEWLAKARPPAPGQWPFDAWGGTPADVTTRIASEWRDIASGTDLDRVCWFRATEKGRIEACEWRARRDRDGRG